MTFLNFFLVQLLASFDMQTMLKLKLKFGVFDHPLDAIFHLIKLSVLPIEVVDESLLGQSKFFNQILFSFDWGNR